MQGFSFTSSTGAASKVYEYDLVIGILTKITFKINRSYESGDSV